MIIRNQTHSIESMKVEVVTGNPQSSLQLQQELSFQLHTTGFMQKLQDALDALVPDGEQLDINSISLNLSTKSNENITEQLVKALMQEINDKIKSRTTHGVLKKSMSAWREEVFNFFLLYGTFPAAVSPHLRQETIDNIHVLPENNDPKVRSLIIENAKSQPVILKRIFYTLGNDRMKTFMQNFFDFSDDFFNNIFQENKEIRSRSLTIDDASIWQNILSMAAAGIDEHQILLKPDLKKLPQDAEHLLRSTEISSPELTHSKTKDSFAEELDRNGLKVNNAGIILLWHAWGTFFRESGWVEDKSFINEDAKQKAILFLHFAAFNQSPVVEDALVLNKLMCNWPLNEPVDPGFYPGIEDMASAESIIDNWLKTWKPERHFSHDWFRLSFLQREGILKQRPDGNWNLNIIKKTEDILIDKPSVIRYAWMDKIIFIQW